METSAGELDVIAVRMVIFVRQRFWRLGVLEIAIHPEVRAQYQLEASGHCSRCMSADERRGVDVFENADRPFERRRKRRLGYGW